MKMTKKDLTGKQKPEEKSSNTLATKEIVVTVSIVLLFALMLILGIMQRDKNVKLEKIVSSLMTQIMKDKVDFLDSDLKGLKVRIRLGQDLEGIKQRVHKNEVMRDQHATLFKTMMDVDESILDACQVRMEALMTSIELDKFDEYLKTYNNIKVVPKKMEE